MTKKQYWKKILRYQQKDAWCGPAVIQMALAAGGFRVPQKDIAKDVVMKWFGTTQQMIYAYLSRYFHRLSFKEGATLRHVTYHLDAGHIVIVNWFDDSAFEAEQKKKYDPNDYGHYSLILAYNRTTRKLTLANPEEGKGIVSMQSKDFNSRWYDTLDIHGKKWVDGWLLWVDPASAIARKRKAK